MVETKLSIGEFAALTHLSVRALRRYHRQELLEPAVIHPRTGYRYYEFDQIPTARVIHQLRQFDVPLSEVRAILQTDDPGLRAEVIAGHLRRLEDHIDRTQAAVASLRLLLGGAHATTESAASSITSATAPG
ncbi:MerR family transcriptional regulator [Mycobacterium sp. MS1601]|uniref:MerR family transcriptional regulator n=1 Tax=Mycobacterium sp. MS1601 TaxID=1936029 RepID=UPI001F17E6AF|nr:helix-turn-helix domain-containing protein [Mycobacterium sp. MS1601]